DQRGQSRTGSYDIGAVEGVAYMVTNINDSGGGSLRQAVDDANSSSSADVLLFSRLFNSAPTLTPTTDPPPLAGTALDLTDSATTLVAGPGAGLLTVSGNNVRRVFNIDTGASAVMSGLKITGGNAAGQGGGGVNNLGTLTLTTVTVT